MNYDILFFLITLAVILIINGAFFIINILFVGTVTAVLIVFQRRMEKKISTAITDTQKMLMAKKTHKRLIKMVHEYFQYQSGAMLGNMGRNFGKWFKQNGYPEEIGGTIESAFNAAAEFVAKDRTQEKKLKGIGKLVGTVNKAIKKARADAPQEPTPPSEEVVDAVGIELTPDQLQKMKEFQDSILTEEQKKQIEGVQGEGKS